MLDSLGRLTRVTDDGIPVVPLKDAPGEKAAWDRPWWVLYVWPLVEFLFVTNSLQPSSRLRIAALRRFGAKIDEGVVFRPRTRVKFPWKLTVGADSWIGEGVWIHNQTDVVIGSDVVLSQETFVTTGSHAHRRDMALIMSPVHIHDGAWVTSRCIVTGGVTIGRSALVRPASVVTSDVGPNTVVGTPSAVEYGPRFRSADQKRL